MVEHSGYKLNITFWGPHAPIAQQKLEKRKSGATIVVVSSTIVKTYKGEYCLPSTSATKMYVDLDIDEASEFKQSSSNAEEEVQVMEPDQTHVSNEEIIVKARKALAEVHLMRQHNVPEVKKFSVVVDVEDIDPTFGWCYIACDVCSKKVIRKEDYLWCTICLAKPKFPTTRYKIELKVADHSARATFVLFDTEVRKVAKVSAEELIIAHKGDMQTIPTIFEMLCGRKQLFVIKLTEKNLIEGSKKYTVSKRIEMEEMEKIEKTMSEILDKEKEKNEGTSNTQSENEDSQDEKKKKKKKTGKINEQKEEDEEVHENEDKNTTSTKKRRFICDEDSE
ncbi:hypothetical protein M5689_024811 [Euphorbia peplus]|nr:hypothetical protein M5689_024811 [Euphorbia peplus]